MWGALGFTALFTLLLVGVWAVVGWRDEEKGQTGDPAAGKIAIVSVTVTYIVIMYFTYR